MPFIDSDLIQLGGDNRLDLKISLEVVENDMIEMMQGTILEEVNSRQKILG